jgi:hypothetical protein
MGICGLRKGMISMIGRNEKIKYKEGKKDSVKNKIIA